MNKRELIPPPYAPREPIVFTSPAGWVAKVPGTMQGAEPAIKPEAQRLFDALCRSSLAKWVFGRSGVYISITWQAKIVNAWRDQFVTGEFMVEVSKIEWDGDANIPVSGKGETMAEAVSVAISRLNDTEATFEQYKK